MSAVVPMLSPPLYIGFSGSRSLGVASDEPSWESLARRAIGDALDALQKSASPDRPLCGISQLAIGGDTAFALACRDRGIPLRVFLPQHRDAYLHAGTDFTEAQRRRALSLFEDVDLVVEERVVSHAHARHARFEDAHHAMLDLVDVAIVLRRYDAPAGGRVGAHAFLKQALARSLPCCEIVLPELPTDEAAVSWPHPYDPPFATTRRIEVGPDEDACVVVKRSASQVADVHQRRFARAAGVVTLTHLIATFIAVLVVMSKLPMAYALLPVEVLMLALGLSAHAWLHRRHVVWNWSSARLLAEVARSVGACREVRGALLHLHRLSFPEELVPTIKAIELDHLRRSRRSSAAWSDVRDAYVQQRLDDKTHGQIPYFDRSQRRSAGRLRLANGVFFGCAMVAMVATAGKFVGYLLFGKGMALEPLFGFLAILGPVVAVGAVSLAAAYDLEARANTFARMRTFLLCQRRKLQEATSDREFEHHVRATEERLLGETVAWFWRRSFVGVV